MSLGRPMGAKLLLEGKDIPFIGASITCAVNQASIAYIDLVPHQEINNIKPRTLCQIFMRMWMDEGPDCVFPYVLAWEGEVFGYTFGKTPSSRNFSVSCIDYTGYWDNVLSYYFNAQQGLSTSEKASLALELNDVDAAGERVIPVAFTQASYFKNKIEEVINSTEKLGKDDPNKKDFIDAIAALYADIGYINEFFKGAEDRLRIRDRIVMHSSKILYKLIAEKESIDWFTGIPGKSSGYTSLRMILTDLLSILFHDSTSMPFPAKVRGTGFMTPGKDGVKTTDKVKKTIGSYVFKPNLYMMPPPICNVFYPDEYASFQFSRNFMKEPTRLIYMPELPGRMGVNNVYLPHIYEPPSFHWYMKKATGDYGGFSGEMAPPKGTNPGHYGEALKKSSDSWDSKAFNVANGVKREAHFLTLEETIKGIILARESMIPASSSFRFSLDDHADIKKEFATGVAKYLFYKRRFSERQLQITSHLKMSVVPGFPVLILDDSDSDQNVVAYCDSVTHRIYAQEGGYTNVQLSYARHIAEQDNSSSNGTKYLIPPWFSEEIFGTFTWPPASSKAPTEVEKLGFTHVPGAKLSEFYKTLLGDKGSTPVTSIDSKEQTLVGAVRSLLAEYKAKKQTSTRDVQKHIYLTTSRDYIRMKDAMSFIGAETTVSSKDIDKANWIEFTGGPFSRKGKVDQTAVEVRGAVIAKYRNILQQQRGFRG